MYRGYSLTLTKDEIRSLVQSVLDGDIAVSRTARQKEDAGGNDDGLMGQEAERKIRKNIQDLFPTGSTMLYERKDGSRPLSLPLHADIFIAHAEKDTVIAQALADMIEKEFGLRVFLDSWYTEHADIIRDELDFRLRCGRIPDSMRLEMENVAVSGTLVRIIDDTECLLFLNTQNAINAMDPSLGEKAWSGRLWYELLVTRLIRRSLSERQQEALKKMRNLSGLGGNVTSSIKEQGSFLLPISGETLLSSWKREQHESTRHPLDTLYRLQKLSGQASKQ